MRIIDLQQNSKPWLEFRRKHIQATDAGIILGLNHWKDPHQLWLEKMGFVEPEPCNAAMRRGQILEENARGLLCEQLGIDFEPIVIESEQFPWMGASLDGYSQKYKCICEIKCMKLQKHLQVTEDTIDSCHFAQMMHQLTCSRADLVYYASYHPKAFDPLTIVKIVPDREYIKNMIEKEKEFFFETMCNMEPTSESWTLNGRRN